MPSERGAPYRHGFAVDRDGIGRTADAPPILHWLLSLEEAVERYVESFIKWC
jgi:hypothetical protein